MPSMTLRLAFAVLGTIVALEDVQRLLWTIFDELLANDPAS